MYHYSLLVEVLSVNVARIECEVIPFPIETNPIVRLVGEVLVFLIPRDIVFAGVFLRRTILDLAPHSSKASCVVRLVCKSFQYSLNVVNEIRESSLTLFPAFTKRVFPTRGTGTWRGSWTCSWAGGRARSGGRGFSIIIVVKDIRQSSSSATVIKPHFFAVPMSGISHSAQYLQPLIVAHELAAVVFGTTKISAVGFVWWRRRNFAFRGDGVIDKFHNIIQNLLAATWIVFGHSHGKLAGFRLCCAIVIAIGQTSCCQDRSIVEHNAQQNGKQ
mmetsp:Transcript_30032/g.82442  ORF Transcript_30032/g.82442 Transcript_30032/m.82442 type:complete len:273 (+) Transcript_30032:60-878(+)